MPFQTLVRRLPKGTEAGLAVLLLITVLLQRLGAQTCSQITAVGLLPAHSVDIGIVSRDRPSPTKQFALLVSVFPLAGEVWNDLVKDGELAYMYHPDDTSQLRLADISFVNASSLPDGEVIINRGLANLLGSSRGLWAAILAHEIAHVARQHWVRRYSFELEVRKQLESFQNIPLAVGDARVHMAALGAQVDAPARIAKFARDLEYEADCDGMMLMARSGYHPDFAFAVRHLLHASDEQPDSEEVSSTHPQWTARDRRNQKTHATAVAEFQRRWPTAASSPGGMPPTIGFVSDSKAKTSPNNRVAVTFSVRCANPQEQLKLALRLFRRGPKSKMAQELIEFIRPLSCSEREMEETFTVNVPADLDVDRNLEARIFLVNNASLAIESSSFIPIHLR